MTTPPKPPLRTGLTTGTCATAASLGAARRLLSPDAPERLMVNLPRGQRVPLSLAFCRLLAGGGAEAGVVKDAGDDPDVTHGALVFARVELLPGPGVTFCAGPGVGVVTREGLPLAVGEPAINPVPRQMMTQHLQDLAIATGYGGGFRVTIGVEDGERLAKDTLNARLGIVGGLSILGTTGIVRPYSSAAFVASIHRAVDVARANGHTHLGAATGATSEGFLLGQLGLAEVALIEMGDLAGALLKYLRQHPVERLSLAGGFAKLTKLAMGHLNLHSQKSQVDCLWLAQRAQELGADAATSRAIAQAHTALQALDLARAHQVPLAHGICAAARRRARAVTREAIALEVWAVDRQGRVVGHAGFGV